jgi:HAD superfamily hydrolase (TIGR01509 family)
LQPTALIFDMDGLMLDTEPVYRASSEQAATELGYIFPDGAQTMFTGRPAAACEQLLIELFGEEFPLRRFRARWVELCRATLDAGVRTKPGLQEILLFAEQHKLAVAVGTSTAADGAVSTLRGAGLSNRFPVVVTGDEVVRGKPAPDIFLEAARRLNVAPGDCVVLEDSEPGILAARSAGMIPILIPDSDPPSEAATRAAAYVLDSLSDARALLARWFEGGGRGH